MPAYNFQERFANLVRSGVKRQTIRRRRKWQTQSGDLLYLFTGQRTKRCQLLRKAICSSVVPIDIYPTHVVLNGRQLTGQEAWELAIKDGFYNSKELYDFFQARYGLPVVGELELIKWT